MDALVAPYTRPPYRVKVLGNSVNHQIARAMHWLMGNATNDHVLFLEKDFRLVESLDCVMQQLHAGLEIINVRWSRFEVLLLRCFKKVQKSEHCVRLVPEPLVVAC
jgi:hypothetical protein